MDAWLQHNVQPMAKELARTLRARIPFYKDFPEEKLQPAALMFITHFVNGLLTGDLDPMLEFAQQTVERRFSQGLSYDSGIRFTAPFRESFFTILRPAIEQPMSGVFEVIVAAEGIFEQLDMVSARHYWEQLERATRALQENVEAQERMLRELSTPLIPVGADAVVMPLIGTLNEARAAQMQTVLLEGITTNRASTAILDLTGVPNVDESVAQALLLAVRSARLLGAEVVLSGIKPAAAQALVRIGVDFSGIVTRSTLKDGIAYALKMTR